MSRKSNKQQQFSTVGGLKLLYYHTFAQQKKKGLLKLDYVQRGEGGVSWSNSSLLKIAIYMQMVYAPVEVASIERTR